MIWEELYFLLAEELCQCSDCKRFYKEHDRLIREFPTFKQQQELNWASIQSFRTLCTRVTNELQRQLSERESNDDVILEEKHVSDTEISEIDDQIAQEIKDGILPDPSQVDPITGEPVGGDLGDVPMDDDLESQGAVTDAQLSQDTKSAEI